MSLWLPRQSRTVLLARNYSRTFYPHRTRILLQSNSRSLSSIPRPLVQTRSKSTQADVSSVDPEKPAPPVPKEAPPAPLSTRVWKKVKHEVQHYWHGSKLLVSDVRIASKMQWKILHGETLTRRERRQVCNLFSSH
jgi:LETM1 and EF-hand domain-containing protein 1